MKTLDLLIVVVAYILATVCSALVLFVLNIQQPGIALVIGAVVGTQASAFLHFKRRPEANTLTVKVATGAVMSRFCIIGSVIAQILWHWMEYPQVVIPIGAIGTFGFPFVLFTTMRNALGTRR